MNGITKSKQCDRKLMDIRGSLRALMSERYALRAERAANIRAVRASDRQSVRRRQPSRADVPNKIWPPPTRTRPLRSQTVAQRAALALVASSHHSLSYKFSMHIDAMHNVAAINVQQLENSVSIDAKYKNGFKLNQLYERRF